MASTFSVPGAAPLEPPRRLTADEFFALPADGVRSELVDGVNTSPTGATGSSWRPLCRKNEPLDYERFGVGEYWIIDPARRFCEHQCGKILAA